MSDDFKNILDVLDGPGGWPIAAIKIRGLLADYDELRAKCERLERESEARLNMASEAFNQFRREQSADLAALIEKCEQQDKALEIADRALAWCQSIGDATNDDLAEYAIQARAEMARVLEGE